MPEEVVKIADVLDESKQFIRKVEPLKQTYCWMHRLRLEDPIHPTERDKKLIEKIKLIPAKTYDKFGKVTFSRTCQKCFNTVIIPDSSTIITPRDLQKEENDRAAV